MQGERGLVAGNKGKGNILQETSNSERKKKCAKIDHHHLRGWKTKSEEKESDVM